MADPQTLSSEELKRAEGSLERLKFLYEQYFLGNERLEPAEERRKVTRAVVDLATAYTNNTGLRFRAQQLKNRLVSYEHYWDRILKEIENGTYKRHRFKLKLHESERGIAPPPTLAPTPTDPYAQVIAEYRSIQERAGIAPVAVDKLRATLRAQADQLQQKFQAKAIEFRVVVEDGKPKLKAKPVK